MSNKQDNTNPLGMASKPSTIFALFGVILLSACNRVLKRKGGARYTPTILCILMLSACNNAPPNQINSPAITPTLVAVDLPESAWGHVELIAQAEQMDAPVFIDTGRNTLFTWSGSQGDRARHYARSIQGVTQILDLPAFFPQQETIFPINRGALKLWLDRNNSEFNLRLQMATISFEGEVLEGIVPITTQRTRNYSALQLDQRSIRIVWSGGLGEVTSLYLHHVDDSGRPVAGGVLRTDGDYPALIHDNDGNVHLFWLSNNGRDVYHARFDEIGDPSLIDIRLIASNNLAVTDAIIDFSLAFDGSYAYLLWNIRQFDDSQYILMSSGQLTDERFSIPTPLVTSLGETIQWLSPAHDIQSPLPMVANSNEDLLLLWFRDGALQESETITHNTRLIGLPYIVTTSDSINVSWSQPGEAGFANLFYVTRPRNTD